MRAALHSGHLDVATRLCRCVLLPQSESPTLRAEWDELLVALRHAVLNRGEIGPLWSFSQAEYGWDDLEVFERLVGLLPGSDPRDTLATVRYGPGDCCGGLRSCISPSFPGDASRG